jgi:hypothetical protein
MCDGHLNGEVAHLPANFDPRGRELRREDIEWQPMIPPPEPPPDLVSLEESVCTRLLNLTQANGIHLELDLAYSNVVVADVEAPHFPRLAMAVERASGFVGGFQLGERHDSAGALALGKVLQTTIEQMGHRPETIRVQRARVAAMLSKIAEELEIRVFQDARLPALNFAREDMKRFFNRRKRKSR